MMISIIIPTKNNADTLGRCLQSIQNLNYPKNTFEVIIIDGHSTDTTVPIANQYGYKIIYEEGGTIGFARNMGICHAIGDFIAFTDADCRVDPSWLAQLEKPFDEGVAAVGGPNLTPADDTEFGTNVGTVLSLLSRFGPRYGFSENQIRDIDHNPTCNVMYRKKVLEDVGGFNPSLITVDDEELDFRIRQKGYRILYTPHAPVYHYRRSSWGKFLNMAYSYGIGRMQAIRLHSELAKWYYLVPSFFILAILFSLLFIPLSQYVFLFVLSFLFCGGIGIFIISSTLANRTSYQQIPIFFALIAIWFWGYGIGMLRGIAK